MIAAYTYFKAPIQTLTSDTESQFFSAIRLANGTFKTTSSARMTELDMLTAKLVRARNWRRPAIIDLAVSSGVTTADLVETMISNGVKPTVTATDVQINAAIYVIAPGLRVLTDMSGSALQYELFGLGIRPWSRRLDFLTGYFVLRKAVQCVAGRLAKKHLMNVKLVSRVRAASAQIAVDLVEDDLTKRNPHFERRFDVVRAANVLNLSYFAPTLLQTMIENLKAYARKPGGLLVINRTHSDGTNHGTIFEISNNGINVLERVGSGSEVEAFVTA